MTLRAALALADRQLDPEPCVWPAFVTSFTQHTVRVAYRYLAPGVIEVLQDGNGDGQTVPCCVLYSTVEGECHSHQVMFSLS